jgi:hypothetical protein
MASGEARHPRNELIYGAIVEPDCKKANFVMLEKIKDKALSYNNSAMEKINFLPLHTPENSLDPQYLRAFKGVYQWSYSTILFHCINCYPRTVINTFKWSKPDSLFPNFPLRKNIYI